MELVRVVNYLWGEIKCYHLKKFTRISNIEISGGTGIAALLFNGDGPTVLLRADFDALPVDERTGLEYASKKRMVDADGIEKPVMHACKSFNSQFLRLSSELEAGTEHNLHRRT